MITAKVCAREYSQFPSTGKGYVQPFFFKGGVPIFGCAEDSTQDFHMQGKHSTTELHFQLKEWPLTLRISEDVCLYHQEKPQLPGI